MLDISHFYVAKKDYGLGSKHCPAKEKKTKQNMFLNLWNKIDGLNLLTRKYQTGHCIKMPTVVFKSAKTMIERGDVPD